MEQELKQIASTGILTFEQDFNKQFGPQDYSSEKGRLECSVLKCKWRKGFTSKFTIEDPCDVISDLELHISTDTINMNGPIFSRIKFNDEPFIEQSDEFLLRKLFQTRDMYISEDVFVYPLVTFFEMFPLIKLKHNKLTIEIEWNIDCKNVQLHATKYTILDSEKRTQLAQQGASYKTIQVRHYEELIDERDMCNGNTRIELPFHHPVFGMSIYGFEKNQCSNISVIVDNKYVYDAPNKLCLQWDDNNALLKEQLYEKPTINFSSAKTCGVVINIPTVINTPTYLYAGTMPVDIKVQVCALNYNIIRFMGGMMGNAYSN